MKIIQISKFKYFSTEKNFSRLKDIFSRHRMVEPYQLAVATGCSLEEATAILLYLFQKDIGKIYILVFHNVHLDKPHIEKRSLESGYPKLPILCDICDEQISDEEELSYDLSFEFSTNDYRMI